MNHWGFQKLIFVPQKLKVRRVHTNGLLKSNQAAPYCTHYQSPAGKIGHTMSQCGCNHLSELLRAWKSNNQPEPDRHSAVCVWTQPKPNVSPATGNWAVKNLAGLGWRIHTVWIYTKVQWVLSWLISHPSTKYRGNLFSTFLCVPADKYTNLTTNEQ